MVEAEVDEPNLDIDEDRFKKVEEAKVEEALTNKK